MTTKSITDLRDALFATLEGVKNGTVDLDKARAVNEVAKTIVETAKVEVDYLRVTGGGESEFIDGAIGAGNLPPGITGVHRHRLAG
jgi:S-adenosylmethionine synthetase